MTNVSKLFSLREKRMQIENEILEIRISLLNAKSKLADSIIQELLSRVRNKVVV